MIMIRITCMLLAILILVGCNRAPFDYDLYERNPIVQVELALHADSESELKSSLSLFAETNGYRLRISRVHPTESEFSVMMWRNDSMVLAANPFGAYKFGIYRAKEKGITARSAKQLETLLLELDET